METVPIVSSTSSCGIYYCPKPQTSMMSPQKNLNSFLIENAYDDCRRHSGFSSSADFNVHNGSTNSNSQQLRNSASYSSYKLIKNSQSSLMPNANKSIIDQPLLLAPVNSLNKKASFSDEHATQAYSDSKLLQSSTATNSIQETAHSMQQMQHKLSNLTLAQQQLQFKKDLDSKLNAATVTTNESESTKSSITLKYFSFVQLFFHTFLKSPSLFVTFCH